MELLTANYSNNGGTWRVSVESLGRRQEFTATGVLDARSRVDQLMDQIRDAGVLPRTVHLLNGSAAEFTHAYLAAQFTEAARRASVPPPEGKPLAG
ncbi:hypothetical protein GCM10010174_05440 [Kutzneria viridogrisea]|uniref:Uncharacterized protein n=2 Tax=Kutzneria TaxID=43356 RepID=W5WB89_9PSEU|nr:hypothetical protein [Kutzneria albida]AHH98045.1 hypothetical protein KALB_4683 [Kutzneria albida DSM 43870]MBA8924296.1 hypothetical protein [Kutzneria viridogrisea]